MEKVLGGMGGCPAEGTEIIWGPAHAHQETVEGRAGARVELGECRAVRAGEGGFLSRHLRSLVFQDYVIQEGADRPGDCVGVEGADGFFVGIGVDYTIIFLGFFLQDGSEGTAVCSSSFLGRVVR